jgi:hypothetical protein
MWLTLVVLISLLSVCAAVAGSRGINGILAASIAAGLCWFGSIAALVVAGNYSRSNRAVQGHLLGMFSRLGLPLIVGIIFQEQGGWLADAGVFGLIVVFYLITLVAETSLSLRFVNHSKSSTQAR